MNTQKSLIEIGIAYNQEKMQVMMAMQMNGKGLVDFVSSYRIDWTNPTNL